MTYNQKTYYSNAKKSEYNGSIYDSKFEAGYAQELDLRKKAGDIVDWSRQDNLELVVNGYVVCNYKIDFIIYHKEETEYVECKGWWTPYAKLKWKLFEALYTKPGNKLTVIMQGRGGPPKARIKKTINR
jgi:predicted nuclease of restriction endonuclease-like RecB superfamily